MPTLTTQRLILRPWRDSDLPAYAAMNADPEVRRWFPGLLSRAESDAQVARFQAHFDRHGFGFWALEAPGIAPFIGFTGLQHVDFTAHFVPAVEIGWRLARAHWSHGFATEAATAALAHGFGSLGLGEIVSFAVEGNAASRSVMTRIGMRHEPEGDFDHPALPANNPLRRHALYRIRNLPLRR
jgi:ribosomal-protein-alanine N-acetyltransferase